MAISEQERRSSGHGTEESRVVRIRIKDRLGRDHWHTADLVDSNPCGADIVTTKSLDPGMHIGFRGVVAGVEEEVNTGARVVSSQLQSDDRFRVALEFDAESTTSSQRQATHYSVPANEPDYYELMQLSSNADPDTIHRVYRILAQRFHPDNERTGSMETFLQLSEAYRVLREPESRAAYDARHASARERHWQIFSQNHSTNRVETEKAKRLGIAGLLYTKLIEDFDHPGMNIQQIESLLGMPREGLQAGLWFLKMKGYITRSDNGMFSLTASGFEYAEANCQWEVPDGHLLNPASAPAAAGV